MTLSGAEMIIQAFQKEGVECVFGIPGGSVIPLYDALYDAPFHTILTRHEQAACHAADGYARVSGKPGVCVATSGPGATNIVTGLANAHMDSVPLVVVTGQVVASAIGTDAFQEADIYGSSLPLVKHSFLVRTIEELPHALRGAFLIASSGRPGPVLVDVPSSVQKERGSFDYPPEVHFPGYHPENRKDFTHLERSTALLSASSNPVIIAGGGCIISGAEKELLQLAERCAIPVVSTLMGKGAFPEEHPLSLGMVGMHGTPQANLAVSEADVILALGTRFSDRSTGGRQTYAPKATIIHVDLDEAELGKNIFSPFPILGDVKAVLSRILEKLPPQKKRTSWLEKIQEWRQTYPLREENPPDSLGVPGILREVRTIQGDTGILATDVGQHQMWAALHYKVNRSHTYLTSGGLGTMGFGLPAAMGAAFARPGERIACISGDGSFLMNIQELETCRRYDLPITVVLCNNGSLGMVRQWQDLFFQQRFSGTCESPTCSFTQVARGFGLQAWRAANQGELRKALAEAFSCQGPSLVECMTSPEDNVYPMVPAGGNLKNFLFYPF